MFKNEKNKIWIVSIFSIAMAYLESVVIFYLRRMYFPSGFGFPLKKFLGPHILPIEMVREFSTIIMLVCVGYLASSSFKNRFAYFLLAFATWDIFYYIWLRILLKWPSSFQTNDLLFLIPWPWVGPILAPLIASLTMILLSLDLLNSEKNLCRIEWFFFFFGSGLMVYTFLIDYGKLLLFKKKFNSFLAISSKPELQKIILNYKPGYYNWPLFIVSEIILLVGIYHFHQRSHEKKFF
jgi:hypothetical protein